MPWGVAAAVGGALVTGAMNQSAASTAADAQNQASQNAIGEQQREFNTTQQNNAPFINNGTQANQRLSYLLGTGGNVQQLAAQIRSAFPTWSATGDPSNPGTDQQIVDSFTKSAPGIIANNGSGYDGYGPQQISLLQSLLPQAVGANSGDPAYGSLTKNFSASDLAADPVYNSGLQFGLNTGVNGINSRAIANGGYDSGATLKALTQFGNDYGSTKANDSFNRFQTQNTNIYNKLAGLSGAGQNAVNTVTQAGTNTANSISGLDTGIGNSTAAGIVGGANAYGSAASGINSAYNNYNSNQTLQKLLSNQTGQSLSNQYGYGNVYGAGGGGTAPSPYYNPDY